HAYLYLVTRPETADGLASALTMTPAAVVEALVFLGDYRMVDGAEASGWRSSADPWDMLLRGLEQRRQRELPEALSTLRDCHRAALTEPAKGRGVAAQMAKMLALAEDLA